MKLQADESPMPTPPMLLNSGCARKACPYADEENRVAAVEVRVIMGTLGPSCVCPVGSKLVRIARLHAYHDNTETSHSYCGAKCNTIRVPGFIEQVTALQLLTLIISGMIFVQSTLP